MSICTLRPIRLLALAVVALSVLSASAWGQCATWLAGTLSNAMNGANGDVLASVEWDPDGVSGPLPPWLIIGGAFTEVAGVVANHVAAFDGTTWRALGSGTNDTVRSLTVYNGDLVAGGSFSAAGTEIANRIARWTGGAGGAWHTMGNGLDSSGNSTTVRALQVYQGALYAGGNIWYTPFGGGLGLGLAKWNGSAWTQLNLAEWHPVQYYECNVYALAVFNNQLIVGGGYSFIGDQTHNYNLTSYDGTSFHRMDQAITTSAPWAITALQIYGVNLVIAGDFTAVSGQAAGGVASFDGSAWHPMGAGLPGSYVTALTVFQSQLVASGNIPSAGGGAASGLAVWNGVTWQPYGAFSGASDYFNPIATYTGCVYNGTLIVGGHFTVVNGVTAHAIALYNQVAWSALPYSGAVHAATNYLGKVVEAGSFHAGDTGGDVINNIMSWNGNTSDDMLTGLNATVFALKPYSVTLSMSQVLLVGGDFTNAGGVAANHVATYLHSELLGGDGWGALGTGVNARVNAVERYNNILYAAGEFTARGDGSVTLHHIARYTSSQWNVLAGSDLNGSVNALKVFNGSLYAGGSFTTSNGLSSGGLARWDGTAWNIVGGSFSGTVYCLEIYGNQLVIGGSYPGLSGSPNLARYSGTTYSTIGTGGTNGAVRALCVGGDGLLYIGGDFTTAGGVSAAHIARWNGSAWAGVNGGTDNTVFALTAYHNEVIAGGTFGTVRSGGLLSQADARFTTDGTPWITVNPSAPGPLCAGGSVDLSAEAADGYANVAFTWRRAGTPLNDGTTAAGTIVTGSHTPNLHLANLRSVDGVSYDCVISDSCGSSTTYAARIYVNSADFNGDGDVGTDSDIEAFFACLSGSCCASCGSADFNGDGDVGTDADIESFFRVLGGGHC